MQQLWCSRIPSEKLSMLGVYFGKSGNSPVVVSRSHASGIATSFHMNTVMNLTT